MPGLIKFGKYNIANQVWFSSMMGRVFWWVGVKGWDDELGVCG